MASRVALCLSLLALLTALLPPAGAAQAGQRCFPETGLCIDGRLREFWEGNGGLPVFGLPITAQQSETIEGKPVQVQWFERHRLELHADQARPYDVLLGRLGVDRLGQQGRDPARFPKSDPRDGCRFFAAAGHNVCGAFLAAWRASGLEFDGAGGASEAENLALFGLPLSDLETETVGGRSLQVQWFERARFELHPANQPPYDVLFGLLGQETRAPGPASPSPPVSPAPAPTAVPAATPASAYDGAWYGSMSRGTELSFTVDRGLVTYIEIDVKPHSDCHIIHKIDFAKQGLPPPRIDGGRVVIDTDADRMTVHLEGTFVSTERVEGAGNFRSVDSGCASSDRFTWSAKKRPPEPVVAEIDGNWSGQSTRGEEIAFTVANRVITRLEVVFRKLPECTVLVTTPQPLIVNSFVLNFDQPVGEGYVNGEFTSSTQVAGFLHLDPVSLDCGQGSVGEWRWKATKQP